MNDARPLPTPARLSGAIWGHLVGDALGVPYEFRTADQITDVVWRGHGAHDQPSGTWSDDGALMLALLDSLLGRRFDPEDQGRRALAWKEQGAYAPGGKVFDIGRATGMALSAIKRGVPATDAGPVSDDASGNGSLMRILPLALVERSVSDERLVEMAHLASRVTHGHPRCQVACAWYSLVVRRLLIGVEDRPSALRYAQTRLKQVYRGPEFAAHRSALDEFRAWTGRSGRGFVIDSFWSAWSALADADSYRDAVIRAVRYGQDTDTTAAIAGGLAGAWFGIDGIPYEWRAGLRDPAIVRPLVDGLIATDTASGQRRTSTSSPLRVDQIHLGDHAGQPGRLGITFLPGKRGEGKAGHHWRDMDADLDALRGWGADTLVSLVEDQELARFGVPELPHAVAAHGIGLIRFPIPDPHIPVDPAAYRRMVAEVLRQVRDGRSVAIACRGGLDRSGMTAACVLREAGLDADAAISRVQVCRPGSISLPEQQRFVRAWPWGTRGAETRPA
jgi:ADP-ribosylglycohydrolase/protein-tyrosine phosphatase